MTPTEILTAARQRTNTVGDNFYSDSELLGYLTAACSEMARNALVIERVYTTSTVASQQEYSLPTYNFTIKRITYDGRRLEPISFKDDDAITLFNSTTTATGEPTYYMVYNKTLYLRPVPTGVGTLKIFTQNFPQPITAVTATLEIPEEYHLDTLDYLEFRMRKKEQNFQASADAYQIWKSRLGEIRKEERKKKRGDSFTFVKDEETLAVSYLGL